VLRAALRRLRAIAIVLAILIAVILATTLTVDLGPALRARAERAGSNWLDRPMTMGRLGIRLGSGRFVVEDLRIGGLTPEARPWLEAKRIEVSLTWGALMHREVLLDNIEMTDWRMVVETFAEGRHNWPRLNGPPRPPSTGPRRVTTTLQHVHAYRGEFDFDDHGSRWGVIAPNLDVTVSKLAGYGGSASFSGGTVYFSDFLPMSAQMSTTFTIDGGKVLLDKISLITDGAVSDLTGQVDLGNWPEMVYQVNSRMQFARMREIFFPKESFSLSGEGTFEGIFHLFKGGRELKGTFASDEAGLNAMRFQRLVGALEWVPDRFEVTRASSQFLGGETEFTYRMTPLGQPGVRPRARFETSYANVDLEAVSRFFDLQGIQIAGRLFGYNQLEWELGQFGARTGEGSLSVTPPAGITPLGREMPPQAAERARQRAAVLGPFSPHTPTAPVGLGGRLFYRIDGPLVQMWQGAVATTESFISFEGETAMGDASRIPFHVTSTNWQESDRLLAGLMTAFGNPTPAIQFDGVGEFEGVMLGAFKRPRIEGRVQTAETRAFGVTWGEVEGDVVIDDAYANVKQVVVRDGESRLHVDGKFSLGFPRRDGGEEINARIVIERRPLEDLTEAFDIEDYPVDGIASGDFHLEGLYTRPLGYGRLTVDDGKAYGEPFTTASASLRFEGNGVRMDAIDVQKSDGAITGAAFIGWNGTYTFNADGRGLAVESLNLASFKDLPPLTGLLDFTAAGSATFREPRYDVKVTIQDLFAGEEGIGQVTGRLAVRESVLTYEMEAASPRLAVSGTGRIALTEAADAELSFRVSQTSLDPYIRLVQPTMSPYTTAVASGTIRVVGELNHLDALRIDGSVEALELGLYDYHLRNQGPIEVTVEHQELRIGSLRLVGDDTALEVAGTVDLGRQALSLQANGAANLAVLQGLFPDVRSSGRADITTLIGGTVSQPSISGQALLTDGRLRQFSFPHALEELNGIVSFNAAGIRLDGLTGKLGGGDVTFGGRIGMTGYRMTDLDVTANGNGLHVRFPEGMRSTVNTSLALQGPVEAPVLSGTVNVENATWTRGLGSSSGVLGFGGGSEPTINVPTPAGAVQTSSGIPVRYDIRILAPGTLHIANGEARISASADLTLMGTLDRPLLFGRAEIERGEVRFEGRRYLVTHGSIDFTNPSRIQPFFDIEAETRVRAPGETYRVTLRVAGTTERLQPEFSSDPPLASLDILTLLFSDTAPTGDVELNTLRQPNEREQRLLEARATRALTGSLSNEVGKVVQQTFGVDTFQITPLLVDPYQQSSRLNVNPAARVTIGKRISDRIFLTYARSLSSTTRDEIILLEYDQSDRVAWVLSQNEDRTYALEVRRRHTF
jgi:hypothetical protein